MFAKGVCGRVTGHWKVDSSEGGCTPFWSYFKDKVRKYILFNLILFESIRRDPTIMIRDVSSRVFV